MTIGEAIDAALEIVGVIISGIVGFVFNGVMAVISAIDELIGD